MLTYMKKRLLAAVMVAVTLLSGCGGGGNPSSSSSETPSSSSQEEVKVIRVGMDGETPGFSSLDENGEMVGLDVDIWKEIGKRTGYEIQFERMEFSSLFSLLDDGRLDTVANEISVTEERQKSYNFSDPAYFDRITFLSRADTEISDPKDLDGMSIGVEPASSDVEIVDAVDASLGITLNRVYYDGFSIQDVVLGRIDMWIKGETGALQVIEEMGSDKLKILYKTDVVFDCAYPFAKTEKGQELMELTNKALSEMREDGTLKALSEKHFGIDITTKEA
ncbi:MAG: amino acid ABC transporter substrate-binding protein [Oscillospiraceae bacterium]|nr:MAG: amino acid ABC transporter substrate-binding protein [Oscillospiraceae bacterium]PWL59878.1 MAG: amino acid ABC transporter substrate-binding protein [Oscillospiraceae bacterium]